MATQVSPTPRLSEAEIAARKAERQEWRARMAQIHADFSKLLGMVTTHYLNHGTMPTLRSV